jgi:hypothetical protein
MTRRITHLIEEHENMSKLFKTRDLDVEFERTHKDLRHLLVQERRAYTLDKEEVFPLNSRKYHQQCKVTMPRGDKNHNGKRNIETNLTRKKDIKLSKKKAKIEKRNIETNLTRKKDRKLSKKKAKIEKLHKVPEGTLQKENL